MFLKTALLVSPAIYAVVGFLVVFQSFEQGRSTFESYISYGVTMLTFLLVCFNLFDHELSLQLPVRLLGVMMILLTLGSLKNMLVSEALSERQVILCALVCVTSVILGYLPCDFPKALIPVVCTMFVAVGDCVLGNQYDAHHLVSICIFLGCLISELLSRGNAYKIVIVWTVLAGVAFFVVKDLSWVVALSSLPALGCVVTLVSGADRRTCDHTYFALCGFAVLAWVSSSNTNISELGSVTSNHQMWVTVLTIAFFVAVKNGVRRLFTSLPSFIARNAELKDKLMFLLEHVVFSIWAYYEIVVVPERHETLLSKSWLLHPALCWVLPIMPSNSFHLFFAAKTGTHVEDLLFIGVMFISDARLQPVASVKSSTPVCETVTVEAHSSGVNSGVERSSPGVMSTRKVKGKDSERSGGYSGRNGGSSGNGSRVDSESRSGESPRNRDLMMDIHHIVTALLCISSFLSGYVKIGSLVMLLHDISDIPLDLLRLVMTLHWDSLQIPIFLVTLLSWAYWRLWILPSVVMWTIMFDSRSFLFPCTNDCFWILNAERSVFIAAIGTLLALHCLWFYKMLLKGYRQIFGSFKK